MTIKIGLFSPGGAEPEKRPPTVADAVWAYLPQAKKLLGERTHRACKDLLEEFAEALGERTLAESRPLDLQHWVDDHPRWRSDWTRKRVMATVQRCFNWYERMARVPNPFRGVSCRAGRAGRPMEDSEFRALLRFTDPPFRRLLIFLRFSGCRPGELSALQWVHFDPNRCAMVLQHHKTSRRQKVPRPRVIIMHPVCVKLLAWIKRHHPDRRYIFLNRENTPWTRSSLALRMGRLRRRARLPRDCKLYGLRHRFGTQGVLHGVNLKTLAELLGHTTTRMTEYYVHIAGATEHLQQAVCQVASSPPAALPGNAC